MEEEIPKAVIKINLNDFLIPFERALGECSNAVYIGLSVLENLKELPEYLTGEDDFMIHTPYGPELQIDRRKTMYREWLIKKGFEDLIKAVTLMLVDICKVLSIKLKLKGNKTWEEFLKIINSPEDEITAKHYPDLLTIVKSNLKEDLQFDKEITP